MILLCAQPHDFIYNSLTKIVEIIDNRYATVATLSYNTPAPSTLPVFLKTLDSSERLEKMKNKDVMVGGRKL